jgi:hypothetical protein
MKEVSPSEKDLIGTGSGPQAIGCLLLEKQAVGRRYQEQLLSDGIETRGELLVRLLPVGFGTCEGGSDTQSQRVD